MVWKHFFKKPAPGPASNLGWIAPLVVLASLTGSAHAQKTDKTADLGQQIGKASGLPIPRYVSLKFARVNLRQGPSRDHQTLWIYERKGLPVEVTAEAEIWYRIRDSSGTEGWVLHSQLSGQRTVLIAPWKKAEALNLYASASSDSAVTAKLQVNVIANVKSCDGKWCHIFGSGYTGYMQQQNLWGVYPNEQVN
ncbi:MAG: SH3 domain-containing protein [Hyphomicrobiales bacterium]|nr:SH3 domain-containing protein [Hyphomicrobiales bacterium]MDE2113539.1 SH3 domain-containing protein [Hyphomicrobiales bacterium]